MLFDLLACVVLGKDILLFSLLIFQVQFCSGVVPVTRRVWLYGCVKGAVGTVHLFFSSVPPSHLALASRSQVSSLKSHSHVSISHEISEISSMYIHIYLPIHVPHLSPQIQHSRTRNIYIPTSFLRGILSVRPLSSVPLLTTIASKSSGASTAPCQTANATAMAMAARSSLTCSVELQIVTRLRLPFLGARSGGQTSMYIHISL